MNSSRPRDSFPPILHNSPPGRSSTLPPIQRLGPARSSPHKQSLTKLASQPHHKRKLSKDHAHVRQMSQDRKAYSVEPSTKPATGYGSRWEDLIEAATSATEDVNEDRTPVSIPDTNEQLFTQFFQMPESPRPVRSPMNRNSLPPFQPSHFQGYQASPLHRALTPPIYDTEIPDPFPSVEGIESVDTFHIDNTGLSNSSPNFSSQNTQIFCAACRGISLLRDSFACTECICGICQTCASLYHAGASLGGQRGKCPRCGISEPNFRRTQFDLR